ncbi:MULTISPECIES: serine/threonine-protein kinase [Streptomyces]|uniref:serine/threonine-protein kinase n=1 Tax=Streptomyces TaxID=1883 RepID=UPI00103AB8CB|nr:MULTISPECIES: serine/threonine-protein kinase [Streptomyces]MBT3076303.1 serine/threonine protein kinase [Streptomyces sp. COG21]MBT3079185.1 serine/threonine protein kinase [Streptomyces sp. COG20]MBT3089058.1 serine/threonine protein kinase [Streptomyces sp. CYG21]MBT3095173.1 serine/threonine protein kinase [Streptomyces sp. CBG30]MBT3106948.1 serine/threonine protein kinase [Streptomyces sp. COG19]
MQPLEAGEPRTIGAYRLLGRLGAGGMGRVYLGRSAGGRTVAVKVVHPHFALDEQFRARFRREVESARRIGAQWTAPVLDADPDAPVPWVATGYVAGPPLSQAITEHGPLPEHAVRTLGAGLAEALHVVHGQGIVHRDVKPSNVLLALDGPRLIDFGIARALGATVSLTSTGVSVGSPGYMAPEQIRGRDVSGAADVFSLGAVLAYAATGHAPFSGDSSAVLLYKVVHEEPELGDLEGDLREVVAGCLAKDPDDRPAPADLARTLAPDGAASMVAAGWLPGRLVGEVSRSAVALLDLEPQDAPVGSGPVPFSSASLGAGFGAGPGGGPASGPDPHAGPGGDVRTGSDSRTGSDTEPGSPPRTASDFSRTASDFRTGSDSGPRPGPPGVFGPPPTHVPDGTTPPGTPPPPGAPPEAGLPGQRARDPRFSVSVTADSQTSTRTSTGAGPDADAGAGARRSRRVSCTVALAVAGAFAVVALGSGLLDGFFPGGDADRRQGNDTAARPPSPTASASGSAPASEDPAPATSAPDGAEDGSVTELPKAFVGTWKGALTETTSGQPHGTLTAVFTEGKKGTQVVRMSNTISQLGITITCNSVGTLTSGTAKELKVRERTDPDRPSTPGLCTTTEADLVFELTGDGTLDYRSEERGAGLPYGNLTRSGG